MLRQQRPARMIRKSRAPAQTRTVRGRRASIPKTEHQPRYSKASANNVRSSLPGHASFRLDRQVEPATGGAIAAAAGCDRYPPSCDREQRAPSAVPARRPWCGARLRWAQSSKLIETGSACLAWPSARRAWVKPIIRWPSKPRRSTKSCSAHFSLLMTAVQATACAGLRRGKTLHRCMTAIRLTCAGESPICGCAWLHEAEARWPGLA